MNSFCSISFGVSLDVNFHFFYLYSFSQGYNYFKMPHGSTTFQTNWLEQVDVDGHRIKDWCAPCKTSKYKAYCTLCLKEVSINNSGLAQLQQHAKTQGHKTKAKTKFSETQRHFVLSERPGSERHQQGPRNIVVQGMSQREKVTKAEALWALKTASCEYSFASSDGTPELFRQMFPGEVSDSFTMSRTKMSYLISDGLGPHLRMKLCTDVRQSDNGYTIQFDETSTSQGRKQCDLLVRYWSEEKGEICVRFLQTLFFGHAKGSDVAEQILETLQEAGYQLPLSRLLSLSSDGPNVNKTIWNLVNKALLDSGLSGLMPFISCNLHTAHNAFRSGLSVYGEECEELAIDLFYWIKSSPARREDYLNVLSDLGLDNELFIRHVQCRWLSLLPALNRISKKWEAIKVYFIVEIPKTSAGNRTLKTLEKNERYKRICKKLQDPTFPATMGFLLSLEPIFQSFLCFLQTEGPLIHVLRDSMTDLLKSVMGRFLKGHVFDEKYGKHLLKVEYTKPDNQLSLSRMEVGEKARSFMEKLSNDQQKVVLMGMKQFYIQVTRYLAEHLPLDSKLLRDVSILHPLLRKSETASQAIRRLAVMMPMISEEEVSLVTDEWKVYQRGDNIEDQPTRIDHYWALVFNDKNFQGQPKYRVLQKLVKGLLSLAHGNADVERSLSLNKNTVTPERASLGNTTINGLRTVKDEVRVSGEVHKVPITKGILDACHEAHKAYTKRLLAEKEQMSQEKRIAEVKRQMSEEAQKEREKEAKRLEINRKNLDEKQKNLLTSEKKKGSELQAAKSLYAEAKERLSGALKAGNLNEATVAQGLLEIAEKKLDSVIQQEVHCASQWQELTKGQKRLVEDYSHLSGKKKKA